MPGGDASSGQTLTAGAFRELVEQYLRRMQSGSSFTDDDYVTMVRLFNTIGSEHLADADPLFARYADAFFPAQVEPASRALGAVPTKGMALYSKRHDLYIGGPAHPPSRYRLQG